MEMFLGPWLVFYNFSLFEFLVEWIKISVLLRMLGFRPFADCDTSSVAVSSGTLTKDTHWRSFKDLVLQ